MNQIPEFLQQEVDRIDKLIAENTGLLGDPTMSELAAEEIAKLESEKATLIQSAEPYEEAGEETEGDKTNRKVAIMEFRPAAGGEEAKIWAHDLMRMYTRYANTKGWLVSELEDNVLKIKGPLAYNELQYEAGVHRVQRVPETESQGRIHTSTATVAVLPEMKATEINMDEKDIEFVAFKRSSGAGGQNVNKVATAVRITHLPSGITVECNRERSQIQNRELAMQMLAAKLWDIEEQKRIEELGDARAAIGRGMRAEKIRTYNYPQNRVTDHRIGKSWQELDQIIDGKLDKVIASLQAEFN